MSLDRLLQSALAPSASEGHDGERNMWWTSEQYQKQAQVPVKTENLHWLPWLLTTIQSFIFSRPSENRFQECMCSFDKTKSFQASECLMKLQRGISVSEVELQNETLYIRHKSIDLFLQRFHSAINLTSQTH